MPLDALKTTLLDLVHELRGTEIDVLLGGGYGLFLKQESLSRQPATTLFPPETWPQARATNDLDLLLRPEIVTESRHMKTLRDALDRLGFEPIPGALYYQFGKKLAGNKSVKIDLHAGQLGDAFDPKRVSIQSRRIKPKPSVKLHAHSTEEAVAYATEPLRIAVSGALSTGEPYESPILVPQGFTYLLMKLFAFRDRRDDAEKGLAQHHALDLYRIVAMLTEGEYEIVRGLADIHRDEEHVRTASKLVEEHFSGTTTLGVLRIREHPLFHERMEIGRFIEEIKELLGRQD